MTRAVQLCEESRLELRIKNILANHFCDTSKYNNERPRNVPNVRYKPIKCHLENYYKNIDDEKIYFPTKQTSTTHSYDQFLDMSPYKKITENL